MIEEDFCSFEVTKLLKENGFEYRKYYGKVEDSVPDYFPLRPSLSMACKWLREVHRLEIYPFHDAIQKSNAWWYRIERHVKGCGLTEYESEPIFSTYEESISNAIKYCLEHLI